MLKKPLDRMSMWELHEWYKTQRGNRRDKETAEVAFALAMSIKQAADRMGPGFADAKENYYNMARTYASDCAKILLALPSETLDDVATKHTVLAEITLPNYFHYAYVVRNEEFLALLD